jgi:Amt family ammonium transporter
MIGAAMLWIGWFGFNAGSAIGANANAAMAMLVTHISAAVATITWMFMDISRNGKPGLVGMITGMVAGLATVTPASGFIGPMGAIILGISSGIICYIAVGFIKNKLNLDDSLDVFAVHGVGGIIGTMLAGVLAAEQFGGLGLETSVGEQTYIQFVGVISVALYTLIATIIITSVVRAIFGLRIDGVEEDGDGVDVNTHGESGYNL